jgi:23S rRNA pseudouridine1911/1915/1917 synthase
MVVAKRSKPAQRLTDALQANELKRSYFAILNGVVGQVGSEFFWHDYLHKDSKTNIVKVSAQKKPAYKEASLRGVVKNVGNSSDGQPMSLVLLTLETGRSHQIRAQASGRGFPLVGDTKYGPKNQALSKWASRPMLHSCYLEFQYPVGEPKPMIYSEDLPEDMIWLTRELKPIR